MNWPTNAAAEIRDQQDWTLVEGVIRVQQTAWAAQLEKRGFDRLGRLGEGRQVEDAAKEVAPVRAVVVVRFMRLRDICADAACSSGARCTERPKEMAPPNAWPPLIVS